MKEIKYPSVNVFRTLHFDDLLSPSRRGTTELLNFFEMYKNPSEEGYQNYFPAQYNGRQMYYTVVIESLDEASPDPLVGVHPFICTCLLCGIGNASSHA